MKDGHENPPPEIWGEGDKRRMEIHLAGQSTLTFVSRYKKKPEKEGCCEGERVPGRV